VIRLFIAILVLISPLFAQQAPRAEAKDEPLPPDWCKTLPRPGYKHLERLPINNAWFEVYRIRPGVFAIYEPHQYEEVISYLVVGSKRALLFDTGLGIGDMRELVSGLTQLPISVLNSHTHFDHIGDNWQFNDILGADNDFTRQNEKGASTEQLRDVVIPERFCGNMPAGFKPKSYAIPAFKVYHVVKDGETIDLGDRQLEVLLTPGHTPDALCLLDRKHKLLFTGDTFYAGPIFLYVPETDVAAYTRSVDKIAALVPQLDLLLPSHNFPEAKPEMLVQLQHAFRKVKEGSAKSVPNGELREYKFDGFSLLLAR
jgi:glyoxylase-like metal-dependent hydrolase (beta-lactamase superfamily II)